MLVTPTLAASHVQAQAPSPKSQALLSQAKADWFALRTRSAEQELIEATKNPSTAAEAHYWLGRIYEFKGSAEGAFPGFHEEIAYRPRAAAEFAAAGTPKPEWIAESEKFDSDLKAADAAIAKLQSDSASSAAALHAAIEARIKLRPDPMSHSAGANIMLARNADLPFVLRLAADGKAAGEQFIRENESSYKLGGKVQASLDRNAATFDDIAGWALFLQGDMTSAEQRLSEAARLFRNNDINNQMHLAELSARRGDRATAEDHYLNVMDLASSVDNRPQYLKAQTALFQLRATAGDSAEEAKAWTIEMLDRKREQRRTAAVSDMLGRELPPLVLKDLQGNDVDLRAQHGNVVLLNFFAAW
jgi:tetratricopeptide (TPR) repeat protein